MSSNFTDPPESIYQVNDEDWREAHDGPKPQDMRGEIQGPEEWLRPAVDAPDGSTDIDGDGGLDRPRPEDQRRQAAVAPDSATQPTRDLSLSRDVDLAASGTDPAAEHGMSDASEIGHPGPLGPDASDQPADAGGQPSGQWGSSGSPTS
jgi:hypothetical protein